MRSACVLMFLHFCSLALPVLAAGGGAGAGGAGHQRAINSGLPPGEPGPAGAPNNPHQDPGTPPRPIRGSPRYEPATPSQ